jgi:hypothetical protein
MACGAHNRLPTWRHGGVWPYELGLATLILWLSAGVQHVDRLRPRYAGNFYLWDLVGDNQTLYAAGLLCISFCLLAGFALRTTCPRCSYVVRLLGLSSASLVLLVFALSFLRAYEWSVGGGLALFLSWRTAAVTLTVLSRARRAFRADRPTPLG